MSDVTFVMVNYKTRALTEICYRSLCQVHPGIPFVLVDNGSQDESTEFIEMVGRECKRAKVILNERNLTHGPALDQGIRLAKTRYVFTIDSDCRALKPFLDEMLAVIEDKKVYAVGQKVWFCRRRKGNPLADEQPLFSCGDIKYGQKQHPGQILLPRIHPARMLLDRSRYLRFRPFVAGKEPELENMADAYDAGLEVVDFPVKPYVQHRSGGTRQGRRWNLRRMR